MSESTKSRTEVLLTSYCHNKNLDEEIKNQEKANNSFEAIKNTFSAVVS